MKVLHSAEAVLDRFLVEQARRGDRKAFTTLAFELSDRLFAVAHRIMRDFDAAGDALQVTLRIWEDLPGLRDADLKPTSRHGPERSAPYSKPFGGPHRRKPATAN